MDGNKLQGLTKKVFSKPFYFIAFGFGSGLIPKAPGTFGTIAALPIYYLLASCHNLIIYLGITILAFLIGVYITDKVANELGVDDYSGIVWDEIVGYLFTMTMAPVGLIWMIAGFILFRFFDIVKPPPIGFIDKNVGGGLGIMLDDLVAAIPAGILLEILRTFTK